MRGGLTRRMAIASALLALLTSAAFAVLLLAMAWGFHRFSGHSYPHIAKPITEPAAADFSREDLAKAVADYPDILDVAMEDLEELLRAAEHNAIARRARGR